MARRQVVKSANSALKGAFADLTRGGEFPDGVTGEFLDRPGGELLDGTTP